MHSSGLVIVERNLNSRQQGIIGITAYFWILVCKLTIEVTFSIELYGVRETMIDTMDDWAGDVTRMNI